MSSTPSVTVAVPLHRSARWVDQVEENVRVLPPTVAEVLVSDRTCVDDAADQLRRRLADQPRVTVVAEADGLGWEDHYQRLLEDAAGDLFLWMPHDDRFDPSWVPTLAAALERHPSAWLAFGHMACVAEDGVTPLGTWPHPKPGPVRGWGVLRMGLQSEAGLPMRGLFRRRAVLDAGIRLAPSSDGYASVDIPWVVAVGLAGGLVFDPSTTVRKRFHPASAHATWGEQEPGSHERALRAVVRDHGPGGGQGLAMQAACRAAEARARLRPRLGPWWSKVIRRPALPRG